jgi:hypothetical protein
VFNRHFHNAMIAPPAAKAMMQVKVWVEIHPPAKAGGP